MSVVSLKQDLPVPLDYQLTCSLRRAIELGGWKPREEFFGESPFAEDFGIRKITVRQALQRLDDLGYVLPDTAAGVS